MYISYKERFDPDREYLEFENSSLPVITLTRGRTPKRRVLDFQACGAETGGTHIREGGARYEY